MNFDELLDKRIIEPVSVDAVEIANLLRVARRDIATAESLLGTDYDWAFAVAYNAVLKSSVAYMAQCGFRPTNRNKHYNTFRFISLALPEEHELVSRLQRFRKKRNTTVYESVGTVGEAEVRDMIAFAPVYVEMIRERLSREVQRLLEEDDWRERRPPRRRARGLAQSITPPSFQPMMRQRPSISRIVHVTVSTSE